MPVVINIISAVTEFHFREQIQKCIYFICEITGFLLLAVMGVHGFENL